MTIFLPDWRCKCVCDDCSKGIHCGISRDGCDQ